MTVYKINVKWGKQTFKDVELDTTQDAETFMTQLYALTNVPVEKQKITIKGTKLKEDTEMSKLSLKDGMTIMMIGTAEGKFLKEPAKQTVFLEDLTPEEKARLFKEKTGKALPAGLVNLGNTCYMNSLVQCLGKVKELKDGINSFKPDPTNQNQHNKLVTAAKQLYLDLDSKGESFPPYAFVQTLRSIHPQFDETDNQGRHMQQDSEECFNSLMQSFQSANMRTSIGDEERNLISHLFDIDFQVTLTNTQAEDEEKQISYEKHKELRCHIDNQNKPINHLDEGLKISLEGEVEKFSDHTQAQSVYKKELKMNNLPPYLVVNLVRFFWKKESSTAGTKAGKSKILRSVSFPMVLDVYDLCSDELKASLDHGRKYEAKLREEYDEKILSGKAHADAEMKPESEAKTEELPAKEDVKEDVKMEEEEKKTEESKGAPPTTQKKGKVKEASIKDSIVYREHGTGLDHGKYQLLGVVTHQGRTADAGHYIGWIHSTGDEWYQCDDDFVSRVKTEDILNLKGGGDWHMAYMLIYRKLEVVKGDEI